MGGCKACLSVGGNSAGYKLSASRWHRIAAEQPPSCTVAIYLFLHDGKAPNQQAGGLSEAVFDNPDAQARVAIRLLLMPDNSAFDGGEPAVNWSIGETHYLSTIWELGSGIMVALQNDDNGGLCPFLWQ